jgi:hypothetical protein
VTFFPITELKSIKLDSASLELEVGEIFYLSAVYTPENTSDKDILWSSSNPEVVEVNDYGQITALKKGTAVITAASAGNNQIKAECRVVVDDTNPPGQVKNVTLQISNNQLNITWGEAFNAAFYEIQYATNSKFKNARTVTSKTTSKVLKNLKSGQTYYVRVRAYKVFYWYDGYGKWSTVKKIKS